MRTMPLFSIATDNNKNDYDISEVYFSVFLTDKSKQTIIGKHALTYLM